ncbi:hypothetical protein M231_03276 [Tremella mesenterica]|uniref:Uncharacterized protein n=1 Tax=Tremella mesenterica TaxID=5217 RepID=A0A4Q1BNJ3_TREME|nr:hypothetical protein M231_03276 [Tremella mesenterica]
MPSTDVARMAMERLSSFKGRVEHEQVRQHTPATDKTRDLEATFGDSHGSCENVKEDPRTTGHSKSSQKATITSGTNEPSQNHSLELPAELSDLERSLLTACRKGYTVLPARSFFADIKGPKEVAWVHFRKHTPDMRKINICTDDQRNLSERVFISVRVREWL